MRLVAALLLLAAPAWAGEWRMSLATSQGTVTATFALEEPGQDEVAFMETAPDSLSAQRKALMAAKAWLRASLALTDAVALEHLGGPLP